jgi:hypothetical protein
MRVRLARAAPHQRAFDRAVHCNPVAGLDRERDHEAARARPSNSQIDELAQVPELERLVIFARHLAHHSRRLLLTPTKCRRAG